MNLDILKYILVGVVLLTLFVGCATLGQPREDAIVRDGEKTTPSVYEIAKGDIFPELKIVHELALLSAQVYQ